MAHGEIESCLNHWKNKYIITKKMNDIIIDSDEKFTWSGYQWLARERWGSIHPGKSWCWYDPTAISGKTDGQINLNIHKNPKDFVINGKTIHSDYGIGIMCCETNFTFGTFEIEAKLPSGIGTWPAFWFYPPDTWPPEIDWEFYSRDTNYIRKTCLSRLRKYLAQSCVHFREEWKLKGGDPVSAETKYFNGHPASTFNRYGINWTPDKLEFLINRVVVRTMNDPVFMNYLSQYKLMVIINNHIDGFYRDKFTIGEPFVINYFKYTP